MKNEVVVTATSIQKAIDEAIVELGANREEVEYEVLEEPSKRIFGGTTNAKVRVFITTPSGEKPECHEIEDVQNSKENGKEGERRHADKGADKYGQREGGPTKTRQRDTGNIREEACSDEDDHFIIDEEELNYNKASKQLSEEELDKIADTAIETIRMFLEYFGAEESDIDEYEGEEGELILDIIGDNLAVLIGRHGKTIDAIQFLVSSVVYKKTGFKHPLVIDVKGYKHRRKQKIVSVAKAAAARAIRQKHEVRLRPMTPYERRIVHVALRDDKRIATVSEGSEPNRYIVIKLK